MQEKKESFVFYRSFFEALQDLKDKDRLKVYDAICKLALNENDTELTGIAKTVFTLIRPQILSNTKKYKDGQKGGRPKKETTGFEKEKTTGYSQKKPNVNVNANANENENVNVNVNANANENVNANANVADVIKAYEENIAPATPMSLELLTDYCKELSPELVIEAIQKANSANKRSGRYIQGILNDWSKKGFKSLIDVQNEEQEFKRNKESIGVKEETEEERKARKIRELEESTRNDDTK